MSQYSGAVTVVLPDGTEINAHGVFASRKEGNLIAWPGKITSNRFGDLTAMHGAREVTLRLPNGRTGKAIVSNMVTRIGGGSTEAHSVITGSGLPPF